MDESYGQKSAPKWLVRTPGFLSAAMVLRRLAAPGLERRNGLARKIGNRLEGDVRFSDKRVLAGAQ